MGGSAYKLWKTSFSKDHLQVVFEEKIRNKGAVGLDYITADKFSQQLNDQLEIIARKCNDCTYHFTNYRQLLISKGATKPPRCISIPTIRDKLVLAALNEVLTGVYGNSVITPMPQIVIREITDALNSKQFDTYIKLDIKSFYASIDHTILSNVVRTKIRKRQVLSLVESAITTGTHAADSLADCSSRETGVPEGLSISNALANLYFSGLDKKYSGGSGTFCYWRYVDDILFLTTEEYLSQLKSDIEADIVSLKLKIEPIKTKTGSTQQGFEYLGYCISDNTISVRRSSVIKLERALETIFRHYKSSRNHNIDYLIWKINLKITGFVLDGNKYGWLFFYSQINDLNCLFHLDWFLSKMTARYGVDYKQFKRFVRSYHEIRNAIHETQYIPNLDVMSTDVKRTIVNKVYGDNVKNKSDELVNRRFRQLMNREIRDIQKDVQAFS